MKKNYNNKKVLVTAGAGFIGSSLAERLVGLGAEVHIIDRPDVDRWRLEMFVSKINFYGVDLADKESTRAALKEINPEIIFNLVGDTDNSQNIEILESSIRSNFTTAFNMLYSSLELGVKKFVQMGTMAEYGKQKAPFREDMQEMPVSPYGASKAMATHAALSLRNIAGLNVTVVRAPATFGPKQTANMLIPKFIRTVLSGSDFHMSGRKQLREFIFIDDLVGGLLSVGLSGPDSPGIINIGTGKPIELKILLKKINSLMGNRAKILFDAQPYYKKDNPKYYCSAFLAKKTLGWRAKIGLREALLKTIEWYKENPSR